MKELGNVNFDQLLNNCFEIEGLISLMRRREEETPEEVFDLLVEKVAILAHDLGIQIAGDEYRLVVDETAEVPVVVDSVVDDAEEEIDQAETAASALFEETEDADVDDEPATADGAAADVDDITLNDALGRNGSADLRSAFSLNDRFRFRRELFGNSDAELTDALNLISAMSSYAEAEDYLYGDLHWDAEGDDVKEFMTIVKNHFDAKS